MQLYIYFFFRYGKGKIASQPAETRALHYSAVTLSLSEDLSFWVTMLSKYYCAYCTKCGYMTQ